MKLGQVAADSETKVGVKVSQERAALRREHEPILLRRRDNFGGGGASRLRPHEYFAAEVADSTASAVIG